jgi:hypothetical protein
MAWPIVVGLILWWFRKELKTLILNISALKLGKLLEITIREQLQKTGALLEEANLPTASVETPLVESEGFQDEINLLPLASEQPRAAILMSWALLEAAVIRTAKRLGWDDTSNVGKPFSGAVMFLRRSGKVNERVLSAVLELDMIQFKVATLNSFEPSVDDAQQFVVYSATVRADLDRLK